MLKAYAWRYCVARMDSKLGVAAKTKTSTLNITSITKIMSITIDTNCTWVVYISSCLHRMTMVKVFKKSNGLYNKLWCLRGFSYLPWYLYQLLEQVDCDISLFSGRKSFLDTYIQTILRSLKWQNNIRYYQMW